MRMLALLVLSLTGVIALLDVAASFDFNGSVNVPPLVILVVALAWVAHLVEGKAQRKVDSGDVVTLLHSVYTLRLLHDIPKCWTNFSVDSVVIRGGNAHLPHHPASPKGWSHR